MANVKQITKKEMQEIAEKLAGPVIDWMTSDERDTYIRGVIDGLSKHPAFEMKKEKE